MFWHFILVCVFITIGLIVMMMFWHFVLVCVFILISFIVIVVFWHFVLVFSGGYVTIEIVVFVMGDVDVGGIFFGDTGSTMSGWYVVCGLVASSSLALSTLTPSALAALTATLTTALSFTTLALSTGSDVSGWWCRWMCWRRSGWMCWRRSWVRSHTFTLASFTLSTTFGTLAATVFAASFSLSTLTLTLTTLATLAVNA
mmetsp:Transcript_13737/g.33274  ORF Transcript_13737/g.33274 Transcript_13737/m.33274 type:complete len:200 (+) Transcript_13737:1-600(+)